MTLYYKDLSGRVNESVTTVGDRSKPDTEYAARTNGVLYIQDKSSQRYVTFKAYLKSFNLSINPTIELDESIFVLDPFVSRGQTLFRYSISLEVPANNVEEAAANLAKMQELFRYVGTLGAKIERKGGGDEPNAKKVCAKILRIALGVDGRICGCPFGAEELKQHSGVWRSRMNIMF